MIYAPRDSKADSGPANNSETAARWAAAGRDRLAGDQPNEEPSGWRYLTGSEEREYLAGHVSYSEAIETIDGVLVPEDETPEDDE